MLPLDVYLCSRCGHMEFFATEEAREQLRIPPFLPGGDDRQESLGEYYDLKTATVQFLTEQSGVGEQPTARDVFEALRSRMPFVRSADAFNVLKKLVEKGMIDRIEGADKRLRYSVKRE